jgi:hypothetical protein
MMYFISDRCSFEQTVGKCESASRFRVNDDVCFRLVLVYFIISNNNNKNNRCSFEHTVESCESIITLSSE